MSGTSTSSITPAQNVLSGTHSPLPAPMNVVTYSPRSTSSLEFVIDPMYSQFGYTFAPSSTNESRHDRRISEILPPYVEESDLPAYTPYAEPITLAMYLFKFGFLFPPFWLFGAFILLSPLREPHCDNETTPAWLPDKTPAEREHIIMEMRKTELKWARRCLYAFIVLSLVAVGCGLGAWVYLRK